MLSWVKTILSSKFPTSFYQKKIRQFVTSFVYEWAKTNLPQSPYTCQPHKVLPNGAVLQMLVNNIWKINANKLVHWTLLSNQFSALTSAIERLQMYQHLCLPSKFSQEMLEQDTRFGLRSLGLLLMHAEQSILSRVWLARLLQAAGIVPSEIW